MRLELFPFRYRDSQTGKWVRARYHAERYEIAARYAESEITGPAEIRDVDPCARAFSPHSDPAPLAHRPIKDPPRDQPPHPEKDPPRDQPPHPEKDPPDGDPPVKEPPEEDPAHVDGLERFLLLLFLRPYVAHCARRRRFAAMNGSARLFAEIRTSAG